MMDLASLIPMALLGVLLTVIIVNVVKALIRGLKKTVGTLVAIILSAIIAGIVTVIICKPSSSLIISAMEWIKGVLPEGAAKDLFEINELGEAVSYYGTMLIAPIFFTIVYSLLSIILSIVCAILVKVIPPYKKPGMLLNRLGGAGVGLVCGVLVGAILLTPAVGMIGAMGALEGSSLAEGDDETAGFVTAMSDIANDPVVNVMSSVGCGPLYDLFASAEFEGEKVYLKEDLAVILTIVGDIQSLNGEIADYDDTQINALRDIISEMEKSALLENTVAGVFSTASGKWVAGEEFVGIAKFSAGELFDPVIDQLLVVMSTTDKNTIAADLGTMIDVFEIMIDSGILDEEGDYQSMLSKLGDGVIANLLLTINANERMSPLADEITALSVRALATTLGLPKDADEQYNNLMNDIASTLESTNGLSEEERREAVHTELASAFDKHGIDIDGEAADNVTDSILADLGSLDQVDPSDVEEFFVVYAIAAAETEAKANGNGYSFDLLSNNDKELDVEIKEDGTILVNGKVLKNYNANSYRNSSAFENGSKGVDFGGAATLSSSETMESSIITMQDIVDSLGSFTDVEDVEAEAEKISNVIVEASEILSDLDFDNAAPEELLGKMGGLLDTMKDTGLFSEDSTANILTAVLQNDSVTSSLGITGSQAADFASKMSEVANKSENGYAQATNAVSTTITAINTSKDPNKSAEEKRKASEDMINVMNADNAEMLSSMMNSGMVAKQGASEEKADNVSLAMDMLLRNLADYKATNPSKEDVAREAEAVNFVLSLSMVGSNSDGKSMFNTDDQKGAVDCTPDEFIHTLVTSVSIMQTIEELVYDKELGENPLGIPALDEAEAESVVASLENYHEENGGGAELARKLEAIAAVINVTIDIQ